MKKLTPEQIAGICHEANRALQDVLGDPHVSTPWQIMTPAERADTVRGIRAAGYLTPSEQHQAWCDERARNGWTYGDRVDEHAKTHPCMLPWELLTEGQQLKDHLFQAIVKALS